jgi:hypothetical protein
MSTRIDYGQIAAKLDYAALEKKLEQLAQRDPPRKRKTAADALEPLRERLLALHSKGWSSEQLANELKTAGVPVSPARLRECLSLWTADGDGAAKSRTRRRNKRHGDNDRPATAANPLVRNKGATGEAQTGLGLTGH